MNPLSPLPLDLQFTILSHLDPISAASLRLVNKSFCRLYDVCENRAQPSFLRPTDSMVALWSEISCVSSDVRRQENINGRRWRKVEIPVPTRTERFASFCRNQICRTQNSVALFPDYNSYNAHLKQLIPQSRFWEGGQPPTLCIGPKKIDEETQGFGTEKWDYLLFPHRHVTDLVKGNCPNLIAGLVRSPVAVEGHSPCNFIAVWQLMEAKPKVPGDHSPRPDAHNIASLRVSPLFTPQKIGVWFGHNHLNLLVLCKYWRRGDLSLKLFQLPLSMASIPKHSKSETWKKTYQSQPLYNRGKNTDFELW